MNNLKPKKNVDFASLWMTSTLLARVVEVEDPATLAQHLAEQLRELTGAQTVILLQHAEKHDCCQLLHVCPQRRSTLLSDDLLRILCICCRTDPIPLHTDDLASASPLHAVLKDAGITSLVRYPLAVGGRAIATLILTNLPATDRVDELHMLMEFLSPLLGSALENSTTWHAVHEKATSLEMEVIARTAELEAANQKLERSRLAALNMMEDAIQAQERLKLTQFALDHSADAVFWIDSMARLIYVNDTACDSLGYTRDELMCLSVEEIEPHFWPGAWPRLWEDLCRMGSQSFESVRQTKDGRVFPVEVHSSHVCFGETELRCDFVHDITHRKRVEAERTRLVSAIEQVAETIVITNTSGDILYVNPVFERTTGYSREEAIGKNPRILKSGQHDEAFYREMWDTLVRGDTWSGRMINKKKDGAFFTEEVVISPVLGDSGSTVNYVAVKRDVTEEIQWEQQRTQSQKMEAVGRLAGGVAHDFNNMLGVILGHATLAMQHVDATHPVHESLEEITKAGQRSADLTRQLLAFARKQTISPQVLYLNEIVAGMVKMLQTLIGENIKLRWTPDDQLWPVKIDPSQVDQLLANLCVNARDAIDGTGEITITVNNHRLEEAFVIGLPDAEAGDYVELTVSDDGRGMDAETLAHVFDPFFTTKSLGQGTGLGLATVYGIMQQNNGFIVVDSELGRGTTFRLNLPRHIGEAAEAEVESLPDVALYGCETILVVEDEPALLNLSRRMLENLGYQVLATESPIEAIQLAEERTGKIDLLLTDVVMPEMDGGELARQLLSTCPDLKCLFVSGYTAERIAKHGVLEDGTNFLQKPFSSTALATKIREVLGEAV